MWRSSAQLEKLCCPRMTVSQIWTGPWSPGIHGNLQAGPPAYLQKTLCLQCTKRLQLHAFRYRSSGCVAWTLAFQDLPTSFVFSVKVNEAVYEILITEKALPEKPTKGKGKGKTGKSKRSPSPATSTAVSTSSATIQEERIDRLEAKVGTLEKKHDALDHKIDNHYSGLSNQLRQVLQHLATPKAHEPSGDTPPPKQPRHAWHEAPSKFSWSPTATFFGALAGCMLWRSLGPEIAVPWYLLPWQVFAVPYQSFFLRREWFHVTLCLATMGFNSSVLLLAPRSRNIWSWFGRPFAFMTECTTCLGLCISMCSHAIMKESFFMSNARYTLCEEDLSFQFVWAEGSSPSDS